MTRKGIKEKYEYNAKKNLEYIVRKNLMILVAKAITVAKEDNENELRNEWLEEASSELEGMCVGWSFMFIEDEDLTREIWKNLGYEELPSLKKIQRNYIRNMAESFGIDIFILLMSWKKKVKRENLQNVR
jgi:hypothetical protein